MRTENKLEAAFPLHVRALRCLGIWEAGETQLLNDETQPETTILFSSPFVIRCPVWQACLRVGDVPTVAEVSKPSGKWWDCGTQLNSKGSGFDPSFLHGVLASRVRIQAPGMSQLIHGWKHIRTAKMPSLVQ